MVQMKNFYFSLSFILSFLYLLLFFEMVVFLVIWEKRVVYSVKGACIYRVIYLAWCTSNIIYRL